MNKIEPRGLERFPTKPINHVAQKVEVSGEVPVIDSSVKLWDAIRLGGRRFIENKVFTQIQISSGKIPIVAGSAIGGGFLASVNWAKLLTGDVFEIIKLVIAIGSLVIGWVWKK